MHTVIIVLVGFAVVAICAVIGRAFGGAAGMATGAAIAVPLWFVGAGINLLVGVKKAGYTVAEELPIFLLVFAVPAAVAIFVWWKFRR